MLIQSQTSPIDPEHLMVIDSGQEDTKENLNELPLLSMFQNLEQSDEDGLFVTNGYKRLEKICDTSQGELWRAEMVREDSKEPQGKNSQNSATNVVVKKICKSLTYQQITRDDNDGMTYCIDKNILKEALLLKYLTKDNRAMGDYVVKFIDFWESETAYYLVTEYIDGMNLKQFIKNLQYYQKCGKLEWKYYQKTIKFIMWQICTSLTVLHNVYHCMYFIYFTSSATYIAIKSE